MKHSLLPLAAAVLSFSAVSACADELHVLGSASSFAVLGATTVTNTGTTVLTGDLGVAPGSAITGTGSIVFASGVDQGNNALAIAAHSDAANGYTSLSNLSSTMNLTGQDLGGLVLTPGVYTFASSAGLTGQLTLDFGGLNDQSFVFQTGSTLIAASGSLVTLANIGTNDSVYWQVGSSATLGTTSQFAGEIVADQSITLDTGASIACGGALAIHGAVTLDTNTIGTCGTAGVTVPVTTTQTPEPGTLGLLISGLMGGVGVIRRRLVS